MKSLLLFALISVSAGVAQASPESCAATAEKAAYATWKKANEGTGYWGDLSGGADIIWVKGDLVSYQVSIQTGRAGSSTPGYSNYSVRVQMIGNACKVVKVRKF